jgi:hypothetical protein
MLPFSGSASFAREQPEQIKHKKQSGINAIKKNFFITASVLKIHW